MVNESEPVHEVCQEMINLISDIRKLVDENEDALLQGCCLSLTVCAGELVQAVIEYVEPDAGTEPY